MYKEAIFRRYQIM